MEYNTTREKLIIPEYGRNIQNLINYAKTIEDEKDRQAFVEHIIELMHQINPKSRNMVEYRERLWRHLFKIAEYDIDVKTPEGLVPQPDDTKMRPEKLMYPAPESKFRHYGHFVQVMIKKAIEMEDPEKKRGFTRSIASYMKLAYLTWNKEHNVNDEIIKQDLDHLSKGLLKLEDNEAIEVLVSNLKKRKRPSHQNYKSRPGKHKKRR